MDKNWEELQKKMREDVDHAKIDVPDALKPKNIEEMLEKNTRKKWKFAYIGAAAAACLCLIIGGVFGGRFLVKNVAKLADDGTQEQSSTFSGLDADEPEAAITTAKDYDEIYEYLKEQEQEEVTTYGTMENEMAADTAAGVASNADGAKTGGSGYSDTNVRQEGVGEADTVKTDGNYIYSLKDGMYIQIVDIRNPQMEVISTIDLSDDGQVSEFYLKDDKLYVCYTEEVSGETTSSGGYYSYMPNTCIKTFDISDRENPEEVAKVSQSGNYYTMRVSGDYIYMISQFYVYGVGNAGDDPGTYIPLVQGKTLDADRIYMPVMPSGRQYTIISSIHMNQPDEVCDTKALLSASGMCYVSTESIYMCDSVYSDSAAYNQTSIRKINYKDGTLTAVGQTKVWGGLNDSFSIDEYEGNLRMVTTVIPQTKYNDGINPLTTLKDFIREGSAEEDKSDEVKEEKQTNALYILDENLKQVSKLEGLAEEEQIYSARFMGDTAYFVTYKQVDPLFSVDLSNPKKPKILGELKIPGFSEYLHPYSEDLLLGIGMDTDPDGMTTNGVKLSMFDISNPASVSEINKQVLENVYGSNVFYDYKAVMIDGDKNLIGFSAYGDSMHYYVYSYDENSGFTCLLDRETGTNWYGTIRGIYAGNTLYIIEGYAIESFDLTTFEKIDDIVL